MKHVHLVFGILILACAAGLYGADGERTVMPGGLGRPVFDDLGRAKIVFPDPGRPVSALSVKKDVLQRIWLVWEEKSTERAGDIYFGRLAADGPADARRLTAEFEGRHHAPDLEITPGARPFAVWIQTGGGESRLILKGLFPERTWIVRTAPEGSLFTPRLLADGEGAVWIFWVEATDGPDEILVSRLEGDVLTPPVSLTPGTGVPHFHPAPGRDPEGRPLLAWTSYDGSDYQIHLRSHDGNRWLKPRKLTDVRGTANGRPAVSLLHGAVPVVAWLRDDGGMREILLSYRTADGSWSPAVGISGKAPGLDDPALAAEGDRLAVSWASRDDRHLKTLTLAELQMPDRSPARQPAPSPRSGFRADDAFIAFGDSITYGILVPPWDIRELGYPPRLQVLLENLYPKPDVINRGVPADDTWGGVSRIADVITDDLALYLLLKLGTNDVSSEYYSMITTAFNLSEMTAKCLKHGVFPLIATIIPRKGDRWNDFTQSRTLNLNNRIRRISREQNILLVDMYEIFFNYPESQGGWRSLIADAPDNLHPSLKGYQLMAEIWYDHITRIPFSPVSPEARRMVREGAVDLSWETDPKITAATELSGYKILRKRKTESDFGEIGLVPSSQLSFRDESPNLAQEPIYALKAVASSGLEGPVSPPFFPVQGDPYPPLNVSFRTEANKALLRTEYINVVSWSDNPANTDLFDIAVYRIYRKKKGESPDLFKPIGDLPAHRREFLDRHFPSAAEAGQYDYGISAVDIHGIEGALATGNML
jgi:lysophospholipase L1-like esterase